ncbi:uncharacterized protein BJX67DRAFT_23090 [Aspergillus lucknowensis]|uniref:Uncharacterized protein n=1 Tax=Aspergillus lucknowensis TaxID=176173 RepID=A0ABR4LYK0_9EURO
MLRLIKREVEGHLDPITKHSPEPLHPFLEGAVCALRSLRGMWWESVPSRSHDYPKDAAPYQHNRCEACMIVRIIMDPKCVQYLHASVLSRTRTTCEYRSPKLRRITEAVLKTYDKVVQQETFDSSSAIASELKLARKNASRSRHKHLPGCDRLCMEGKHQEKSHPLATQGSSDPRRRKSSSRTLPFCMVQEAPASVESGITPQKESGANPQGSARPYELLCAEENANTHRSMSKLADFSFLSPEEAEFTESASNLQNDEESRQRQIIDDIINAYASRWSLVSQNAAALDLPSIAPLSVRKQNVHHIEHEGTQYEPTNGTARHTTPPGDIDWGTILNKGKQGSPVDTLIRQIERMLVEEYGLGGPDGLVSTRKRFAADRANSYRAALDEDPGFENGDNSSGQEGGVVEGGLLVRIPPEVITKESTRSGSVQDDPQ